MQKKTTNEHQWTRISWSGSEVGQEDFCSLFGERCRCRREAVKRLSLFVWIRVHSWLNCMDSVKESKQAVDLEEFMV